jgi:RHS repeat-associated protein
VWGQILNDTNISYRGRYGWTGRDEDAQTGLQYNRARWYDPVTGRWISQDPLGFDAGDSNLYRYVNNRPNVTDDPSGMEEPYRPTLGMVQYLRAQRDLYAQMLKKSETRAGELKWQKKLDETEAMLDWAIKNMPDYLAEIQAQSKAMEAWRASEAKQKEFNKNFEITEPKQLKQNPLEAGKAQEDAGVWKFAANGMAMVSGFGIPAVVLSATISFSNGDYLEGALWLLQAAKLPASLRAPGVLNASGQIAYRSTDLSRVAAEFRQANAISAGRNVAVFEYRATDGTLQMVAGASVRGQQGLGHAERNVWAYLQQQGIEPSRVTRIYSERQPCNLPGGYCDNFIKRTFTQARVTWSFEYGATPESREAGKKALRLAVEQLGN